MVYRVFVEKKREQALEARSLLSDLNTFLGIRSLKDLRILNRYDAESISKEAFEKAVRFVISEPQLDIVSSDFSDPEAVVFAVEYLPGQFDQRADSAAQCIQILTQGERPIIRSAKVYALYGELTKAEIEEIKKYVINPVEARIASLEKPETLKTKFEIPTEVKTLDGFCRLGEKELKEFLNRYGLAMDLDDLLFCQNYFQKEGRDPTVTEIRMIDTYWSDHCRHTTFLTVIDKAEFEDPVLDETYQNYLKAREEIGSKKPVTLMDLATIATKVLKKRGQLPGLDESEEINACTVKITIECDGKKEPWLLLFKNETHNHPTEIEPFGGAATCIGGAIRDPLSGRSYVYGAMRLTGAGDPTVPIQNTLPGKLPQRKLVTTAAAGYSSYGNQIGLATGIVDELYHPGYVAKRMEIGAVVAAAPQENVRRERPLPGDVVLLLGGATGRDGIGGATGSSKAHNAHSVETCGAEVQKGNAPEERKLQRLFRRKEVCRLIKRCNDFGAGGVSVAIGELADGLEINLDAVPKKYEGLDGTELAISESQERMAVVVEKENVDLFLGFAAEENLSAVPVATVKEEKRLTMRWNGKVIVDVSREFLNSNGAEKHTAVSPEKPRVFEKKTEGAFSERLLSLAGDLNVCSKKGLSERFDSTIGAGTVLMPFGGKHQMTPVLAMAQKISVEKKHTDSCSVFSWGYNPYLAEKSPYHASYLAVVESVSKLIATGADFREVYLTFQEYFEKPGTDPARWGKPFASLLGAFRAQMEYGIASIGGKDSMSGSFEKLDVPPTLVSFAVTMQRASDLVSPEFKKAGSAVYWLRSETGKDHLPSASSVRPLFDRVTGLVREKKALSVYTPGFGGAAEAIMKMSFGNGFGFAFSGEASLDELFGYSYGSFLIESEEKIENALFLGKVTAEPAYTYQNEKIAQSDVLTAYEEKLESVYPVKVKETSKTPETISCHVAPKTAPHFKCAKPKVLIPAFPGTNCEYDSAKAVRDAGCDAEIFVIRNQSASQIAGSVEEFAGKIKDSQIIFIPGGFSGGDEPDGSGKFITAFFRNEAVRQGVTDLLEKRDGLMCGICNGFQALIKLGLVPYGRITDPDENAPTLTFNTIGRHQSKIVRTRVCSDLSPWLSLRKVGDVISVPISHGEGRFFASNEWLERLKKNGQIATQYVDLSGLASSDVTYNPNGSAWAIEGITSPDGRVFGKMGHSERIGSGLYRNVPGEYDLRMFESAVKYFK